MLRTLARRAPLVAFLFVALAAAPGAAQADPGERRPGRGGRGRFGGRQAGDVAGARQALLDAETPTDELFTALLSAAFQEATNRTLPSTNEDPDANYSPEYVAFRAEVYGPLRERPATRAFLRRLAARAPAGAFDFAGATAAMVLADAPDEEDLAALHAGYRAAPGDNRSPLARQLGRAVAALRAQGSARAQELLDELRADAAEGNPNERGAAIEALWRAGAADDALRTLKAALLEGADPLEAVPLLSACSRLLRRNDVDPFLRARALAAAGAGVEALLDPDAPVHATQVISGEGRALRAAIGFLRDLGGDEEFGLLMRCLAEPRAHRLLGMDGLQQLRFALQARRAAVAPELGAQLDERYLAVVLATGERLFALEEEPLDRDEQRAFFEARDLRYNALSYLVDQFVRAPALEQRLHGLPELPDYLAVIARSRAEEREDPADHDSPYIAVEEKLENRVLALQLLALVQRKWNRDPGRLDLFAEAFALLCREVQAQPPPLAEVVEFRRARAPGLVLELAIGRAPDDPWVQRNCAQAIANLGWVVETRGGRIRIEADAQEPWPWPDPAGAAASGS